MVRGNYRLNFMYSIVEVSYDSKQLSLSATHIHLPLNFWIFN